MRIASSVMSIVVGMIIGGGVMISCSDDSPSKADAACGCPAAEPPIAGRVVIVDQTQVIAANSTGLEGASCPEGAQLLSGSCKTDMENPIRDVTLQQSGTSPLARGWNCFFRNNEATPVTIRVSAICLVPPS
jgi:hypothetical protein